MNQRDADRQKVVGMIMERVIKSLKRENFPVTKESVALVFTEYLKAISERVGCRPVHREIIAKYSQTRN